MNDFESEFEDAIETARALLSSTEDSADLWEANDVVNHALSMRPANADAWVLKCQILSALDDDTAALAAIEMAVRRAPRSAEALYWRAAILADLERYKEALRSLERAFRCVNLDGDDTGLDDALLEDLYFEKASILDAIGRADEAHATYEAGLARCPDSLILRAGLEPIRQQKARARFTVIQGGRR